MNGQDLYSGLNPRELWKHFAALNAIPRRPGCEEAARLYVEKIAASADAAFDIDNYGNCVVRTAVQADQTHRSVAVQAHLDMVCESAEGTTHDFDKDPILPVRDGDKIAAQQTTLGADNGIGVAAALALLTDPTAPAGPLELIFTVEEEIGLLGALNLDVSLLRSRCLINLDSEDDTALTVGCAGEQDLTFTFELPREVIGTSWSCLTVNFSGLSGGHSGVQIHERRASAIKLLTELLVRVGDDQPDYRLVSFVGGSAHNAIPREANAVLAIPTRSSSETAQALRAIAGELTDEWQSDEPTLRAVIEDAPNALQAIEKQASRRFLGFLREAPHGAISMSDQFANTVATSANLAMVQPADGRVEIVVSIRGLIDADVEQIASQVKQLGVSAGAGLSAASGYPGWEPRPKSRLAVAAASSYKRIYEKEPSVEVVHGGLECGVLVARLPGLDAVSFGPRIREAHTPQEHVYASTVDTTWKVLLALLHDLHSNAVAHAFVT
jgi:dipeptidase D